MLEKNTRKTLTAEPLRKLSLRISGCDAAPVVPWNRDGSHGFSPVKAHADSAGVSCRVATTATCEKRYLPNGLVSLLQSIEASVARRPLGLQLAGGSGASHRFEHSGCPWFLLTYTRWFSTAVTRRGRPGSTSLVTGVAAWGPLQISCISRKDVKYGAL